MDEHGLNEAVAAYMRQLIQERLTTKMLEIVDELQVMYSHDTRGGSNVFPVRAGELSARTVVPCIEDLSFFIFAAHSALMCILLFLFCFLMLRGKQYSRLSLQRINTHRLAPAAGQPGAGVREGRHACDEPGPAAGAGGGGAAQVAAHSGNAVKLVPTLLRTYLLAELSVELNGCNARRTVLCNFI
jgi:hypothetical protein